MRTAYPYAYWGDIEMGASVKLAHAALLLIALFGIMPTALEAVALEATTPILGTDH